MHYLLVMKVKFLWECKLTHYIDISPNMVGGYIFDEIMMHGMWDHRPADICSVSSGWDLLCIIMLPHSLSYQVEVYSVLLCCPMLCLIRLRFTLYYYVATFSVLSGWDLLCILLPHALSYQVEQHSLMGGDF